MDFKESINESYDIEYQEQGEIGEPVLILKDIDNNSEHRFYPDDIKKLRNFITRLEFFKVF